MQESELLLPLQLSLHSTSLCRIPGPQNAKPLPLYSTCIFPLMHVRRGCINVPKKLSQIQVVNFCSAF